MQQEEVEMEKKGARRHLVLEMLEKQGGMAPGIADGVSRESGVPAADIYGAGTFYTLLNQAPVKRVCQGLSCRLAGGGDPGDGRVVSCLGQCDRAPAALDEKLELIAGCDPGAVLRDDPELPINLAGAEDTSYSALSRARAMGTEALLQELKASGLQGRGGAGFPAHFKWSAVRGQADPTHYVVVNADEGGPGTPSREPASTRCARCVSKANPLLDACGSGKEAQPDPRFLIEQFPAPPQRGAHTGQYGELTAELHSRLES